MAEQTAERKGLWGWTKFFLKRYLVDAMSMMALGLFASVVIGLILTQLSKIPYLGFLSNYSALIAASSPVVGAAIGAAIAWGLKVKPLVLFSSIATGAFGYSVGGPLGAFVASVIGAELGNLVSGKTKIDIVLSPFVTIVAGGIVGQLTGPTLLGFTTWLGNVVNAATTFAPIPMGIVVAVIVGLVLTMPFMSSAALCIAIGISGIAAGAATIGCASQMIGFAVSSFRDNGVGGLIAQGLGTSKIQYANITKNPRILLAPTLTAAILGPISTSVFQMQNISAGAGMGTSGLVGQFGTFAAMSATTDPILLVLRILLLHFALPALLTLLFDFLFRKLGWVKKGDMALYSLS